jgi:hypothetical protein
LIQLGYKQGGTAGFGLRRVLVDQAGQVKATPKMGEHKSLQTDRVILVPGPDPEVDLVRWMYRVFVEEGRPESAIAADMNARGIVTDFGRTWSRASVHQVLTNEKYIGNNVYHRTSFKLKRKYVVNPPDKWVRADGVFRGIVDPALFLKAHEIILTRNRKFTNDEMLEALRSILSRHGKISGILIDEAEGLPSSAAFSHRFGSLVSAYRLIGYDPGIDFSFIEINRRLRAEHASLVASVIRQIEALGASVAWDPETELLHLNQELRVSLVLCRHLETGAGSSRWLIRLDASLRPDITVAVRMNATNDAVHDYYLLPGIDMTWENLRVAEDNGVYLDSYRFDSLEALIALAERISIQEAA